MIRPTAVVIGTAKAGTTSLWDLLRQHPEVAVCHPKEINFFSHDENYAKGWSWYEAAFPGADKAKAIVDVSPAYGQTFMYPDTPGRIAEHLPEAVLIYVARHPLDAIVSTYGQCLYGGHSVPRSFSRAVREFSWLLDGRRYWRMINDFRGLFPDDQIKILFFEDFREDPSRVLANVCRLLGVDDAFVFSNPGRPRNAAVDHMLRTRLGRLLRRVPGAEFLRRRLTSSRRKRILRWFSSALPSVSWDADTLDWVRSELRDDTAAFLDYAGKPRDYWRL